MSRSQILLLGSLLVLASFTSEATILRRNCLTPADAYVPIDSIRTNSRYAPQGLPVARPHCAATHQCREPSTGSESLAYRKRFLSSGSETLQREASPSASPGLAAHQVWHSLGCHTSRRGRVIRFTPEVNADSLSFNLHPIRPLPKLQR